MSNDNVEPRWHAAIKFRTDHGSETVAHKIEELEQLQGIVEHGPDWNTIIEIRIVLARASDDELTLEQAGLVMPGGERH